MENEEKVVVAPVEGEAKAPRAEKKPFNKDGKKPFKKDGRRPMGDKRDLFNETVVYINRVSKTVKGGRRMRFAALVAVGDNRGNIGYAMGKSAEVPEAIKKASEAAKKNLVHVQLVKGDTISHEVMFKYGACSVYLKPAPVGTGVIAGGPVRAVLELAGVKNIYSKIYGSRSAINVVKATVGALTSLKTLTKVANLRGKDIKDIR